MSIIQRELIRDLQERGFDRTTPTGRTGARPECSQCEATVINGVACHETGCLNARHECKGCYSLVPLSVTYCEECRS